MSANSLVKQERLDGPAFLMATIGTLAHGGMLLLDAALVLTSVEVATRPATGDAAALLATALTGVVILHLLVLAWCARHVVEWVEVATDRNLPVFTRRTRTRAAARRAGTALLLTGGLAPVTAAVLFVLPLLGPAVGPFAAH